MLAARPGYGRQASRRFGLPHSGYRPRRRWAPILIGAGRMLDTRRKPWPSARSYAGGRDRRQGGTARRPRCGRHRREPRDRRRDGGGTGLARCGGRRRPLRRGRAGDECRLPHRRRRRPCDRGRRRPLERSGEPPARRADRRRAGAARHLRRECRGDALVTVSRGRRGDVGHRRRPQSQGLVLRGAGRRAADGRAARS